MSDFDDYLVKELEGDTLTPILIYQRISGKKKFLLESSLKHEKSGRYSFIGADPVMELIGEGDKSIIVMPERRRQLNEKPLDVLKTILPKRRMLQLEQFPFSGGAIGYIGYDAIRQYEKIGRDKPDELKLPDVHLLFFEEVIIFDHLEQKVYLIAVPFSENSDMEILKERMEKRYVEIKQNYADSAASEAQIKTFKTSIKKEDFMKKVVAAKEFINQNEASQVVLSQRLQASFTGDPFTFYRKLRVQNPSPYMYYIDFADYQIVGSSPESLIKVNGGKVTTNPIAGTRPRGLTEEDDRQLAQDLINDEKEISEHMMLLNLGKEDLNRICKQGTIKIEKEMQIEIYKHVIHLVSQVGGELKDDLTAVDALISCLPAGTVSGAPKVRAMEIINELEEMKRGVYAGAIGYFSINGNMDIAIAIRTMLIKAHKAYIQAGAGIVKASVPEKEYEETLHKLRAFLIEQKEMSFL